jgi:hypothetical protein
MCGRFGVEIESCWRVIFFPILPKNRLGVSFGNKLLEMLSKSSLIKYHFLIIELHFLMVEVFGGKQGGKQIRRDSGGH